MSVLYFSSVCPHSQTLLRDIQNAGVTGHFAYFDVSTQRGRPKYVDRVPLLVHEGRIYTDDELFKLFVPALPDIHDPRVRLQQTTSAPSPSADELPELDAYNDIGLGANLSGHDALGPLDQFDGAMDMDAPVELMELPECEPIPNTKNS
jgi:hypothetical protein